MPCLKKDSSADLFSYSTKNNSVAKMQQNPDDSFNIWKKAQLWRWSKVMLGDKLIVANIGGGVGYNTAHLYFCILYFPTW